MAHKYLNLALELLGNFIALIIFKKFLIILLHRWFKFDSVIVKIDITLILLVNFIAAIFQSIQVNE